MIAAHRPAGLPVWRPPAVGGDVQHLGRVLRARLASALPLCRLLGPPFGRGGLRIRGLHIGGSPPLLLLG
eukprot:10850913-Alexandrium_andersonii.AAC.1